MVGAGFAGAFHARTLAEGGCSVHFIDKRPPGGGNAPDFIDDNGMRLHTYRPHLFHTKMPKVLAWIMQFGDSFPTAPGLCFARRGRLGADGD